MKTYDPKKVIGIFAGIPFTLGAADGTFISIAPITEGFKSKVGAYGDVVHSRQHDRRYLCKVTLLQTSEVNDRFSALYAADRAATNGRGVGTFYLADQAGTTLFEAAKARIMRDPDAEFGMEAGNREWTIELTQASVVHGSISDD